ncbi:MAG TPA: class I SAM-dependent methyltransferase [Terriglobia bacterium]|nr:class I SAM-dependent methyltransferase [Terriglobia bacterium]
MPETNTFKPEEPALRAVMEMQFSMAASRVLASAVQLGIFSQIAAGHTTAAEIAKAAEASERGMQMLLDALTGFRLLNKDGGRYALTAVTAQFLVRESPQYAGAMLEGGGAHEMWNAWGHLTEAIRSGKPERETHVKEAAEEFFPNLVRSLHVMHSEPAKRLAAALAAGTTHKALRVVDVACGSGVWGMGIAAADRQARVTAQDFPKVLDLTREYLKRGGMEAQYDFLPGDLNEVDYGENRFDVALLGNICHGMGEQVSRALFARLSRALSPGGRIVILDMIPNDDRTGPVFPLIFALNMLLLTENGGTYTVSQYRNWLGNAGFQRVETADIGSHSPAIIGVK